MLDRHPDPTETLRSASKPASQLDILDVQDLYLKNRVTADPDSAFAAIDACITLRVAAQRRRRKSHLWVANVPAHLRDKLLAALAAAGREVVAIDGQPRKLRVTFQR